MKILSIQNFSKSCNTDLRNTNCCPPKSMITFEGGEKIVKKEGFWKKVLNVLEAISDDIEYKRKIDLEKEIEENDKYNLWGRSDF